MSRATVLLFILLAGCGFQLRGAANLPPEMARTYINTVYRHSLFYRTLRDGLRDAGIDVVETPVDATAVFEVIADDAGQRVLSVSARNVPTEFEVYYAVSYAVSTPDAVLLPRRSQTITRDYTWDETLVLGKEKEAQLLTEAIADDLVRVILIQLSGI